MLDLILPSRCAVCERPGTNLCDACRPSVEPSAHQFERANLTGFAATTYTPEISRLLVAFKDKNQSALISDLAPLLEVLAKEVQSIPCSVSLVPAPSRPKNFAKRGFVPSLLIARSIADLAANATVFNCLTLDKEVQDQVGLDAAERANNLRGAMRLTQSVAGRTCLIVDDIVTTGATVLEAWRTLSVGGALVLGVASLAE